MCHRHHGSPTGVMQRRLWPWCHNVRDRRRVACRLSRLPSRSLHRCGSGAPGDGDRAAPVLVGGMRVRRWIRAGALTHLGPFHHSGVLRSSLHSGGPTLQVWAWTWKYDAADASKSLMC
jgi:hypothetical protein